LVIHAGLLAWGATRLAPTVDEPNHLAAGICRLAFGRFDLDPGNPPLVGTVAAVPVLLAGADTHWGDPSNTRGDCHDFVEAHGARSLWLVTVGRWACIPFSLLGGYICFCWARELYGSAPGFLALALWCFCPNIIANGQLITGDMAATAIGTAALYAFWRWLCRPSWVRASIAGVVLGVAQVSKFVWVVLYLFLPLVWLAWRGLYRSRTGRGTLLHEIGQGAAITALSIYLINLSYAFDRPFHALREFRVGRHILEPLKGVPRVAAWAAAAPMPFPMRYLKGIDEIEKACEVSPYSYPGGGTRIDEGTRIGNETRSEEGTRIRGRHSFFTRALLLKLPLGSLAIVVLACAVSFVPAYSGRWKTELILAASAAVILGFVTWCGAPPFFRFVLPVLPLVYILTSKTGQAFGRGHRVLAAAVAGCLGWSVAGSLFVYPHSLSYYNELAGGPRHGNRYVFDRSIDWGQDLLYLKKWLDERPQAPPVRIAYFGRVDPRWAGIECSVPPKCWDGQGPQPGWYAVSLRLLQGLARGARNGAGGVDSMSDSDYAYFRRLNAMATAGYSIYIYHITLGDANRVRRELGLAELPKDWQSREETNHAR
jgi:4-amino-4-deoxy-L-arabinose transferase-like glycosyltransferase